MGYMESLGSLPRISRGECPQSMSEEAAERELHYRNIYWIYTKMCVSFCPVSHMHLKTSSSLPKGTRLFFIKKESQEKIFQCQRELVLKT